MAAFIHKFCFFVETFPSPKTFKIKIFSVKHSLQKDDVALLKTTLTIFHLTEGILLFFLNNQTYFGNAVLFLLCPFLNELLWLLYRSLVSVSASPR